MSHFHWLICIRQSRREEPKIWCIFTMCSLCSLTFRYNFHNLFFSAHICFVIEISFALYSIILLYFLTMVRLIPFHEDGNTSILSPQRSATNKSSGNRQQQQKLRIKTDYCRMRVINLKWTLNQRTINIEHITSTWWKTIVQNAFSLCVCVVVVGCVCVRIWSWRLKRRYVTYFLPLTSVFLYSSGWEQQQKLSEERKMSKKVHTTSNTTQEKKYAYEVQLKSVASYRQRVDVTEREIPKKYVKLKETEGTNTRTTNEVNAKYDGNTRTYSGGENKGWKIKFSSIALEVPLNVWPLFFFDWKCHANSRFAVFCSWFLISIICRTKIYYNTTRKPSNVHFK